MSSLYEGQKQGLDPKARHPRGAGLLLFDLDDTIVQAGSYVSPRVLRALSAAREAGYVLAIASGRPACMLHQAILKSGVMSYAVCANGAMVDCLDDGRTVVSNLMSKADALACLDLLAEYGPAWNAFFDGQAFFEWKGASYMLIGRTGAVARAARSAGSSMGALARAVKLARRGARFVWRLLANPRQHQVRSLRPHVERARAGIQKLGCTIADERLCGLAVDALRSDGRFEVVAMGPSELEITARGVTKATGARALMRLLDIDADHAVAFGDGGNDLPLADAVGHFVAMGNADEEVKAAADEVCPPVFEDGVAQWIETLLAS